MEVSLDDTYMPRQIRAQKSRISQKNPVKILTEGGEHMEWIQLLNKAIDYMEANLTEDIGCKDVAAHVHISMFHFQRTFHLLTRMTVSEYMRNRRLSLAGEELTRPGNKVIDVALKYGYETPESFAKAFQRFHGITPMQAKRGSGLKSFNRLTIKISVEGGSMMEYRIEKQEALELLVYPKMFTEETSKGGIPAFWEEYYQKGLHEQVPGYLGICAQEKTGGDTFLYGIGCDAKKVKEVPEGVRILTIPAYTWAVFKCVGPMPDAIRQTWDRIYREWLPGAEYALISDYDIEHYLPGDNQAEDYVSEVWIPVREK